MTSLTAASHQASVMFITATYARARDNTGKGADQAMELRPNLTLNQITDAFPATLAMLTELGFDTCCGGWEEIGAAATKKNIPWEKVVAALTPALKGA
jgi:hypothetical protein